MLVVTAAAGEERAGCLVGFATQCSIDPARLTRPGGCTRAVRCAGVGGRVVERFDVGDHTAFVLEPFAGEVGDDSGPQLGFQAVRGFNPGHEA